MDFIKLKILVDSGFSHRKIAQEFNCSQSNIKYWLHKYELKTIKKEKVKFCELCGKLVNDNKRNRSRCQTCTTRIRRYRTKQKAVELLGAKCNECGWSGNLAAFEFHHINQDKEFTIANMSNKSWNVLKQEILKCELLCSNCHRIKHTKYNKDDKFMSAVNNYKGHRG
jgi:predicted transcriptional regulator